MTESLRARIKFGPFEADLKTRELWKGGLKLKLSGQPFEILAMLVERPSQLVTREELRKRIWSEDTFVDFGHGLNAAVNKLRDALSDSAEEPRYIETLPRRGYRFRAEVARVGADSGTGAQNNDVAVTAKAEESSPAVQLARKVEHTSFNAALPTSRSSWL